MFKRTTFFIPILFIMMSGITYAAPGNLDTTFNPPHGAATYDSGGDESGYAVAIQSDGKIVVAGISDNGTDFDVLVIRYNSDGSLDTSFGTNGVVTYDSGGAYDYGCAVAIQSDGKIVVAGYSLIAPDAVLVLRYNTDGSLDTSFGTDGIVTWHGGSWAQGYAIAIQSDEKMLVAGISNNGTDNDSLVLRLNTDGSLDTSFGTNGVVTYDSGDSDWGRAVAIQSDGKIVVAGRTTVGPMDTEVLVLRYNTDGSPDGSFGTNGTITTDYQGGNDEGWAVAVELDGKIVAVGRTSGNWASGAYTDVLVLRYNSDGSLDTGFGINGVVTYDSGGVNDYGYALAIQSDGRIVVGGIRHNGTNHDLRVLRYTTNGSLDSSFGTNGVVTYAHDQASYDYGYAVDIQSDGRIVVVGETDINGGPMCDVLIARLMGGDAPALSSISYSGDDSGSCFITSAAYGFRR